MSTLSSRLIAAGLLSMSAVSANAAATTYMPVGDSITEGKFVIGGYRLPLQNKLTAGGFSFDFVGKEDDGAPANDTGFSTGMSDPNHEGYGSFRVDETLNGGSEEGHTAPSIASTLTTYHPNVVLLMIGTNDILQGRDPATSAGTLDSLVGAIFANDAGVHLLLASITPLSDANADARAVAYNSAIPAIITKYKGMSDNITFVDMHAALNTTTDLSDGIHPTAAGFQKMADAWYAAATVPEPTSMSLLAVASVGLMARRRK
jgi:lysophospholipase L1-like esterase